MALQIESFEPCGPLSQEERAVIERHASWLQKKLGVRVLYDTKVRAAVAIGAGCCVDRLASGKIELPVQIHDEMFLGVLTLCARSNAGSAPALRKTALRISDHGDWAMGGGKAVLAGRCHGISTSIFQLLAERAPENINARLDLSVSLGRLCEDVSAQGQYGDALELGWKLRNLAAQIERRMPGTVAALKCLITSEYRLGREFHALGHGDSATRHLQNADQFARALADRGDDSWDAIYLSYGIASKLGELSLVRLNIDAAVCHYTNAERFARKLLKKNQSSVEAQMSLGESLLGLGDTAKLKNNYSEAENRYVEALKTLKKLSAQENERLPVHAATYLAGTCGRLGQIALERGDLYAALSHFGDQVTLIERMRNNGREFPLTIMNMGVALARKGDVLWALGDTDGASKCFEERLSLARNIITIVGETTRTLGDLMEAHRQLGDLALSTGDRRNAGVHYASMGRLAEKIGVQAECSPRATRDLAVARLRTALLAQDQKDGRRGFKALRAYVESAQLAARVSREVGDPAFVASILTASLEACGFVQQALKVLLEAPAVGINWVEQATRLAERLLATWQKYSLISEGVATLRWMLFALAVGMPRRREMVTVEVVTTLLLQIRTVVSQRSHPSRWQVDDLS
jgi:tetratricopeptide (TPR) repeat protein